jgi:hypothetical protein
MKLNILIILSAIAIVSCNAQNKHNDIKMLENDKTYNIWTINHEYYNNDEGFEVERDVLVVNNCDFIKSLPLAVKTIIARYTTFLPDYVWKKETQRNFAQALGDFSTLKEAQETLLKDWNTEKIVVLSDYPAVLQIRETDQSLFFEYKSLRGKDRITDAFKIGKDEHIDY